SWLCALHLKIVLLLCLPTCSCIMTTYSFLFFITRPPPISTLFPYTTLFRSKTLLMASSVRLKPLNCSRLPCVYAQETLTFSGFKIGRAVQQECRDRSRMPSSA